MSEYIITDKQFKTATEAYLEHELSLPITEVFISGDKLPEIVRCRDCKYKDEPWNCAAPYYVEPNGFCAWGERRERESAEVWNQWSADDVTCSEES